MLLYFFQCLDDLANSGPVASNHGNLYTTILALVLRALQSTHAEVNITGEGKGENRDGNG